LPGVTLLVADHRGVILENQWGNRSVFPETVPLIPGTLYDVASLTKPLITALLMLKVAARDRLPLETPVCRILSGFHPKIRVIDLLTHRSGYPAWYPLYLDGDEYLPTLRRLPLRWAPGRRVHYSCLGYILLMAVIETITRRPFRDCVGEMIIRPLGLKRTFLGNLSAAVKRNYPVAPTEQGNGFERQKARRVAPARAEAFSWRKGMIEGETHDGNSFYRGGCAGNAGLFTTARDLYQLSLQVDPKTTRLLTPATARLFWQNFTPSRFSHRTAGFKLNTPFFHREARSLASPAIGHNGFTGCSLWIEKQTRRRYILMSNRVHPRVRESEDFNRIRRRIHQILKREGY